MHSKVVLNFFHALSLTIEKNFISVNFRRVSAGKNPEGSARQNSSQGASYERQGPCLGPSSQMLNQPGHEHGPKGHQASHGEIDLMLLLTVMVLVQLH